MAAKKKSTRIQGNANMVGSQASTSAAAASKSKKRKKVSRKIRSANGAGPASANAAGPSPSNVAGPNQTQDY